MGAWGAGLFSDDFALDVKGEYRDLISGGASAAEAKATLIAKFKEELNDTDTGPVFWLSLAATAWKLGRLDDDLRSRALTIIETGQGLDLWDTPQLLRDRKKVLSNLALQLNQEQPREVTVKKPKVYWTDWEPGEIIGLQTLSASWVLLHVVGHANSAPHLFPICELLTWRGQTLPPSQRDVDKAGIEPLLWDLQGVKRKAQCFVLHGSDSAASKKRVVRIGMKRALKNGFFARFRRKLLSRESTSRHHLAIPYIDAYLQKKADLEKPAVP